MAYLNSDNTQIQIFSYSRNKIISLNGDIQSFSDNYTAKVNSEEVYGRIDPIKTYSGTTRQISFTVLLDSTSGPAQSNFLRTIAMAGRMYGRYTTTNLSDSSGNQIPTAVLKSPPLFAIKVSPIVVGGTAVFFDHKGVSKTEYGMLPGFFTSFQISYDTTKGIDDGGSSAAGVPREMTLSFAFEPLHDRSGGFDEEGEPNDDKRWPF